MFIALKNEYIPLLFIITISRGCILRTTFVYFIFLFQTCCQFLKSYRWIITGHWSLINSYSNNYIRNPKFYIEKFVR